MTAPATWPLRAPLSPSVEISRCLLRHPFMHARNFNLHLGILVEWSISTWIPSRKSDLPAPKLLKTEACAMWALHLHLGIAASQSFLKRSTIVRLDITSLVSYITDIVARPSRWSARGSKSEWQIPARGTLCAEWLRTLWTWDCGGVRVAMLYA